MKTLGQATTGALQRAWVEIKKARGFDTPSELHENRNPCAVILMTERKARGQAPILPTGAPYDARDTQHNVGRSGAMGSTEIEFDGPGLIPAATTSTEVARTRGGSVATPIARVSIHAAAETLHGHKAVYIGGSDPALWGDRETKGPEPYAALKGRLDSGAI